MSTKKNANRDYYSQLPEKFIKVNALIDTGATHSIIDTSVLNKNIDIEETLLKDRQLSLQGSLEILPVYKIGLCLFEKENSIDVRIAAKDLSIFNASEIKMIIGRDILSECIFTYNGIDNTFTLDHKI